MADSLGLHRDVKKEPPLRYPLPPPFVPLEFPKVEAQIGLLQPFYHARFDAVRPPPVPVSESSTISVDGESSLPPPPPAATHGSLPPLQDDPPNPLKIKMGPLGQITVINTAPPAAKKKPSAKPLASLKPLGGPDAGGSFTGPGTNPPAMNGNASNDVGRPTTNGTGLPNGTPVVPSAVKKKKKYPKKEPIAGNGGDGGVGPTMKGKGKGQSQGIGNVVNMAPQPALMVS